MLGRARAALNAQSGLGASRAGRALRRRQNWVELAKFGTVGGSGYVLNLAVYTLLIMRADVHFRLAAACSFVVAASNNYLWNRVWTFRRQRGHFGRQGLRFFAVSSVALGANQVWLTVLVALGAGKILAQAIAIILVMPLSFAANKLWSFRVGP